jgi:hypothetical protein
MRSRKDNMDEKCRNCEEGKTCVPFFAHENTMMHYNFANRRMLIALVSVCLTFIITIIVFVNGYTAREKNWLDTLGRIGVTDGVHEQPDP